MPVTNSRGQVVKASEYAEQLGASLLARGPRFADLVPDGVDPVKLVRGIELAVARDPKLCAATPSSLFFAAVEASRLGLEVGGPSGQCYIIPYRAKDKTIATLVLGFKGALSLARRSPRVGAIRTGVVYQGDDFESWEDDEGEHFLHRPRWSSDSWGDVLGAWASADLSIDKGVSTQRVFVPKLKLEQLRKNSRSRSGPWSTHPAEMSAKTAVLRLCKLLPIDAAAGALVARDEYADEGVMPEAEVPAEVLEVDVWLAEDAQGADAKTEGG